MGLTLTRNIHPSRSQCCPEHVKMLEKFMVTACSVLVLNPSQGLIGTRRQYSNVLVERSIKCQKSKSMNLKDLKSVCVFRVEQVVVVNFRQYKILQRKLSKGC